jgi:hypothetical protein
VGIIDPRIILGAVAPTSQTYGAQGPMGALHSALQIGAARERLASERLERQQREQEAADSQKLRDIFANAPDDETAIRETMKVAPTVGLKLRGQLYDNAKARQDAAKAEVAARLERATMGTQALQGVKDEPTFQAARQWFAQNLGDEAAAALGDHYDPNVIATHVHAGTKVADYLRAVNDDLQRGEVSRHNQATEAEATRSNQADESTRATNVKNEVYNRDRNTSSQVGDRSLRTKLYGEDLKADRDERKRHNMTGEILDAQKSGESGGDASYKRYKDYVSAYEHAQGEARMRAADTYDADGMPASKPGYIPPPAFEKWQAMTDQERQTTISNPDARISDAEMAKRRGVQTAPIASVLNVAAAPPAPAPTPAPAQMPVAPPPGALSLSHGTPVAPVSSHATPPPAAPVKPKVQVGQVVSVKGRQVRITKIYPDGTFDAEAAN